MIENEIPKYRKKKDSSVSKTAYKSRHKHEYVDCLLVADGYPHKSQYCKICGKIGKIEFLESESMGNCLLRFLSKEEIYDKYKGMEIKEISNLADKYVSL